MTTVDPPVRRKPNRWVANITEQWRAAHDAWSAEAERVAIGYVTELAEFEASTPQPRLKDFMVHMSEKEIT
jgi:hypothetical protein